LKRNEAKYRARNRARRTAVAFEVFRPETIDLMRDACARLEAVAAPREGYTERDIPGLGKNYLREASRLQALAGYRFHPRGYLLPARAYATLGLPAGVRAAPAAGQVEAVGRLLHTPTDDPLWEHRRRLLAGELGVSDVRDGLRSLPAVLDKVARDVEESKA